jgi:hypothetical protein
MSEVTELTLYRVTYTAPTDGATYATEIHGADEVDAGERVRERLAAEHGEDIEIVDVEALDGPGIDATVNTPAGP